MLYQQHMLHGDSDTVKHWHLHDNLPGVAEKNYGYCHEQCYRSQDSGWVSPKYSWHADIYNCHPTVSSARPRLKTRSAISPPCHNSDVRVIWNTPLTGTDGAAHALIWDSCTSCSLCRKGSFLTPDSALCTSSQFLSLGTLLRLQGTATVKRTGAHCQFSSTFLTHILR
jgi:hypothetical protein